MHSMARQSGWQCGVPASSNSSAIRRPDAKRKIRSVVSASGMRIPMDSCGSTGRLSRGGVTITPEPFRSVMRRLGRVNLPREMRALLCMLRAG